MKYIEVKIKEIVQDPESEGCFRLVLEDLEEGLELPMVISPLDARPLQAELEKEQNLRPQTHDTFVRFIEIAGYQLHRVHIHDFRRGVFYASALFTHPESEGFEMDCRPTDGIALALRTGASVYVAREVMERVGVLLNNDMSRMKLPQRLRVMEKKLQRLVSEERYEEAGILRDRIRAMRADNL